MAGGSAPLKINIVTDARAAQKGLADLNRKVDEFGKQVGGHFRAIGATLVGAFAAVGAVHVFENMINGARDAAKATALTAAVIKSTGGAANVTADQVDALATKLSNLTGVDDDVIHSGENLLLTFTAVRNGIGKGNDIFNQATQAALDMSAAVHEDLNSAVTQLGKALQDPIKGMTALHRIGVDFTKQQVDQVKAMVAAGDTMGAQKLILQELEKEYGGASAASHDAFDKAKVAVDNLTKSIGGVLLPVLTSFLTYLTTNVMPIVNDFFNAFEGKPNDPKLTGLAADAQDLGKKLREAVSNGIDVLKRAWDALVAGFKGNPLAIDGSSLQTTFYNIGQAAKNFYDWFNGTFLPWFHRDFIPAFQTAATAVSKLIAVLSGHFGELATVAVLFYGIAKAIDAATKALGLLRGAWILLSSTLGAVFAGIAIGTGLFLLLTGRTVSLGNGLRTLAAGATAQAATMVFVFRLIVDAALIAAEVIVEAFRKAFGWIPGVGPKLDGVVGDLERFRSSANSKLDGVSGSLRTLSGELDAATHKAGGLASALSKLNRDVFLSVIVDYRVRTPPPSGIRGMATLQYAGMAGGIVTRPTFALIGEAGPEAVVPLNRAPGASALPGKGGGITVNNNFYGPVTKESGAEAGRAVVAAIRQYQRLNGTGWLAA